MSDSPKTMRLVLLGTVHRAVVTRAELDEADLLRLDRALLEAAGFLEHEKIEVSDLSNGSRLALRVVAAEQGAGAVEITGPAAHLVRPGDLVSLSAFGWLREKAAAKHTPREVLVDGRNRALTAAKPAREKRVKAAKGAP